MSNSFRTAFLLPRVLRLATHGRSNPAVVTTLHQRQFAGHSKWQNIRHKKAKEDSKRMPIISKHSQAIKKAVRKGGGSSDPNDNLELKRAIEEAKKENVSKEVIQKALSGGGAGVVKHIIDLKGPRGASFLVEMETGGEGEMNEAKKVMQRFVKKQENFSIENVQYMYKKRGLIQVPLSCGIDEEEVFEIAAEAGADDIIADGPDEEDGNYNIYCLPAELNQVLGKLEDSKLGDFLLDDAGMTYIPKPEHQVELPGSSYLWSIADKLYDTEDAHVVSVIHNLTETKAT
eukprot:gb/GEZN01012519.1/.p1 GENE.gb/GEZN01012519.1/~~gb/GEZN01012519.1/.p1  ORF type:complete len:288 (-),score=38.18 gb/GEZN01012519.1/:126-989(-)